MKLIPLNRSLEIAAAVVMVLALGYAGYQIFSGMRLNQSDTSATSVAPVNPPRFEDTVHEGPKSPDTSSFQKVFSPAVVAPVADTASDFSSATWPTNLKIVGLIMGKPSEVIFENSQDRQTFFVEEGGQHEDFKVLEIKQNGVLVDYHGKKITLDVGQ